VRNGESAGEGRPLPQEGFFGRHDELARMSDLVAKVVSGTPQVVWVRGEAGIGKTTFARRAVLGTAIGTASPGFTVLHATADQAESVLEFGVVEQLVRRIPARPRSPALLSGPVPPSTSPFAVGAELLDLLSTLQNDGPVAMIVDDLQWIDAASAHALGFVLRRMWADQVLALLISREPAGYDPESPLHGLDRSSPGAVTVRLEGLHGEDVAELSRAVRGYQLPARAAERLRAHTGGNPLHIRALLYELPADVVADENRPLPTPRPIVTAVSSALDRLPPPTRALLEALAVLDEPSPRAHVAHVAGIDDVAGSVGPGIEAGLLAGTTREPSTRLRLAHGLHREAIYDVIPPVRRGDLHRRAAEVTGPAGRWAHRVAAATAADPVLAAELDAAAEAEARSAQHALAARYLRWSADLSADRAEYERRLLRSCVQTLFGHNRNAALALREEVERCGGSPLKSMTLGLIELFAAGDRNAATRHLTAALDQAGDHDVWVRAVSAAGLSGASMWHGAAEDAIAPGRLALRLGDLPVRLGDFVRVFVAVARCRAEGMAAGLTELGHLPADPAEVAPEQLDSLTCRGAIHTMLGRFGEAEGDLRMAVAQYRAGVYTMAGTTPHSYLAAVHYVRGEWEDASILVHQALSLADPDEQPHHRALRHMVATLVPAGRGEWATAAAHVARAWSSAHRTSSPQDLRYAAIAEATLHQARGRPAEMLAAMRKLPLARGRERQGTHTWWGLWWRPLLVEALAGTGGRAEAAEHLAELRRQAADVRYLDATLLRLETALSPGTGPGRAADKIGELAASAPPASFSQAMLEALYGERLATAGRADEATPFLTSARARFAALSAKPFEERVSRAISRCAPAAEPAPAHQRVPGLSGRESQIAHLVRLNHTNREIAAQLYVTTKTVEYHLGNIFLKLGISGRRQLRELLAPPAGASSS